MVITIELPIYYTDIVVVIEEDWTTTNKKFKLKLEEEDLKAHALTAPNPEYTGKYEIYLLLKPVYLDYNTLYHEMMHVIMYICSFKGIAPDPDNDEPLAYLQGYIGEEIMKFRDKYLEKQKKLLPL